MEKKQIRKKFDEYKERKKRILENDESIKNIQIRKFIRPLLRFVLSVQRMINGQKVEVPKKELELLYFLASNPNKVFSRDKLLDSVWGYEFYGNSRTVDVHIHRLRERLEGVSENWSLKTINGVGYKFETK